jgi:hypothetical protein
MTREPTWCPANPSPGSPGHRCFTKQVHDITAAHQDQVNADMLAFSQG